MLTDTAAIPEAGIGVSPRAKLSRVPTAQAARGRASGRLGERIELCEAEASTNAAMSAQMLSYSRAQGVFAGVSLEGSSLGPDDDSNKDLYGKKVRKQNSAGVLESGRIRLDLSGFATATAGLTWPYLAAMLSCVNEEILLHTHYPWFVVLWFILRASCGRFARDPVR